jgi:hypothetical protein
MKTLGIFVCRNEGKYWYSVMKKRVKRSLILLVAAGTLIGLACLFASCSDPTPEDTYLEKFATYYSSHEENTLEMNNLSLYVDYSKCIIQNKNTAFFKSFIGAISGGQVKHYYSIKGSAIQEESNPNPYDQIASVDKEYEHAELERAAMQIVKGNTEAVLLTDGEYFPGGPSKANSEKAYLAEAFKTWLLKGNDIHFIIQDYKEKNRGETYNKKLFYIIFTRDDIKGNIWDAIAKNASPEDYPNDIAYPPFKLSASHPDLFFGGNKMIVNESLGCQSNGYGDYEIQHWTIDWKGIESIIMSACDPQTGNPLKYGDKVAGGMKIERVSSFGGFEISGVTAVAYDINEEYSRFFNDAASGAKKFDEIDPAEISDFFEIDKKAFQHDGSINLYFNVPEFAGLQEKRKPYNYIKVDLCISDVTNTFRSKGRKTMFEFEDVTGEHNVSVANSIEQCLTDPDIEKLMKSKPFYTIYIQTLD